MGNPEEHEPGKELGAERASQAQMAFAGSRRATRVYCERDPDADLDAHFIAGTFRAFFFFRPDKRGRRRFWRGHFGISVLFIIPVEAGLKKIT